MPHQPKSLPEQGNLDDLVRVYNQHSLGVGYRQDLIRTLEDQTQTTVILYMGNLRHAAAPIILQDVVMLESVLRQTAAIKNLDLIVNSPGGQGEAADKILHVCREFCKGGRLRLIVPHYAKSAATMLAFGADEVVMGPYSELGPIDAQIKVVEGGVEQFISAQRYVDLFDDLQRQIRDEESSGQGIVSQALLVQLASLNKPFVEHCRGLQNYALAFAMRWMCRHVLRVEHEQDAVKAGKLAVETGNAFLRSGAFSHGEMLTARDLKTRSDIHIRITELEREDPVWRAIWQIHCACEVFFAMPAGQNVSKLFESAQTTLPIY